MKHRKYKRGHKRGQWGELYVRLWLIMRRWTILKHQWKTPLGEIDIIAQKGRLIAFIEVKNHASYDDSRSVITPKQQKRIINAARFFIKEHPAYASHDMRFDAILLHQWWAVEHIADAWRI